MLRKFITTIRDAVLSRTLLEFTAPNDRRALYLTFDDGPTPGVTDELLDVLEEHDAKATFFVIGRKVEKSPELARKIVSQGHTIGNHSYSHPRFAKLTPEQQDEQVDKAQHVIQQQLNTETRLFRVPRGRWSLPLMWRLKKRGIRCIHWSTDSMDYDKDDASQIVSHILNSNLKPGQILLFHDDSPLCIEIMKKLLPKLSAMDFNLAPMDY